MSPDKNFEQFVKSELNESLASLEEVRRNISKRGIIGFILCAVAVILFIIAFSGHVLAVALVALIIIIPGIFILFSFQNRKEEFTAGFKERVISPLIKFIDPGLEYQPDQCISEKDYEKSGLYLTSYDRFKGDDYIEGTRGKTFCFSEIHTQHQVREGKSSRAKTIFKGLFFIADFNKNFSGRTYVWNEDHPQVNLFSNLFSSFTNGLEKVKLESIDFENRFIVYSTDQVEARYILTPSFMERLMKLEEIMGSGLSFSFVNTNIYAAVPLNKNLFEPSIFSPNDYGIIKDYYNTVQTVFTIIDELQLNQRLWTKV